MLRPVLCRLVSDALDGDAHLAFECGMALELVHGGALIHDDWIDGDSFGELPFGKNLGHAQPC